ncbi:MAG TPA: LemA family protein [Candidatus Woesebacteria bacterium]|nr:LemA family protein [Candidatus Woesebacteria bacterium]
MNIFTFILIVVVALGLYSVSIYNLLQKLKTQIEASIQEIGNQLKRQAALIPNLETSVKSYLQHERGIFQLLADARQKIAQAEKTGSYQDINQAIDQMQSLVPQLKVVMESNPELKSDQTVIKFMNELTDTADKITYARRSVIDLTQSFNQRLVTFPSNLIASAFGFKKEPGLQTAVSGAHLEVSAKEMEEPKVNLN